jgi:cytochrome c oxidase subunit 2
MYVVMLALLAARHGVSKMVAASAAAEPNRQVVQVTGRQFGFVFSRTTMYAGRQVEFHLRSDDVNHAFAVYDPNGVFVTQAQMMPDHPQELRVTFTKPGVYTVRCFEYCGVGHHLMQATFRVVP